MSLDQVLAETRADANALRRCGDRRVADIMDTICARVESAAVDWLTWISETEALSRSGKSPDYLRARREQWAVDGLARKDGKRWLYRRAIVPRSRLSGVVRAEAAMERAG